MEMMEIYTRMKDAYKLLHLYLMLIELLEALPGTIAL